MTKPWTSRCIDLLQPPRHTIGHWCAVLGELKQLGEDPERIISHLEHFTATLKRKHQHPRYFMQTYARWSPEVRHRLEVDRRLDAEAGKRKVEPRDGGMARLGDIIGRVAP